MSLVVEKTLLEAFESGWNETDDCMVKWPGVEFNTPNKDDGVPYAVITLQIGSEGDVAGKGGGDTVMARNVGIVYVGVYYPAGMGVFKCLTLGDKAKAIFELKQFKSGSTTITCGVGAIIGNDDDSTKSEGWIRRVVRIPFYWDSFITI